MLEIKNLHARSEDTEILKGINLRVQAGEVHAIMGPNGSGKSTLAHVLAGREDYEVTEGEILFNGKDLLELSIEERSAEGLFMAYQYPVEIPGVSNKYFLKAAINSIRKYHGQPLIKTSEFLELLKANLAKLGMDKSMMERSVNEGFSGGEKKRNEILQMAMLRPRLAVLDETDSGLDIDALKIVAEGVNALRAPDRGMIVVTHYQRLLDYIVPDFVNVLAGGKIVRSGDRTLAHELEAQGYAFLETEPASV
jgi:Fe-S cluster assembly ATP-binding protein